MRWRADFEAIINAVPQGAKVLDVGCSDGQLMQILATEKQAIVRGMEISQVGVNACVAKGLSVIQGDADLDLGLFGDNSFDVVVLSNTIQATLKPKKILEDLKRIGKRAIISLPNFAYWRARLYLFTHGKMPITKGLPDSWHETQNLHLCSVNDFCDLAQETGFKIVALVPVNNQTIGQAKTSGGFWVNLMAESAVFVLERENNG